MKKYKIVFIGSGNLATQLSQALQRSGQEIVQVYSKTFGHASCLGEKLHCPATDNIDDIVTDADIYIFSVKDDALPTLIEAVSTKLSTQGSEHSTQGSKLFLHTAGSVPMSVFEGYVNKYGVFYPMQTFSKTRDVYFSEIPVFVEGCNPSTLEMIVELGEGISGRVVPCDSECRKYLHLAAVFACNMTNHCYRLCEKILEEHGLDGSTGSGSGRKNRRIDFSLFHPLIMETARKVGEMSPREAQTGPMVRYDRSIMDKQQSLISNPLAKELYRLMAKSIHEDYSAQKI